MATFKKTADRIESANKARTGVYHVSGVAIDKTKDEKGLIVRVEMRSEKNERINIGLCNRPKSEEDRKGSTLQNLALVYHLAGHCDASVQESVADLMSEFEFPNAIELSKEEVDERWDAIRELREQMKNCDTQTWVELKKEEERLTPISLPWAGTHVDAKSFFFAEGSTEAFSENEVTKADALADVLNQLIGKQAYLVISNGDVTAVRGAYKSAKATTGRRRGF